MIEKITGQAYADYVKGTILAGCGIQDMLIAGNTLAEKSPNEVVYEQQSSENPYGMNVRRMDSHGGWIATPSDMVQFATHVDGFNATPNILGGNTIRQMTTGTAANPHYACGWCVNNVPNWWHVGSLPGTSTILVRTASGLCWAAFINTHFKEHDSNNIDQLMWKIVTAVPAWRA